MESNRKEALKKISIFLGVVVILGGSYGIFYNTKLKYKVETENAYVNGEQSIVNSQLLGTVKNVYRKEMEEVKVGDLLLDLDSLDYEIALEGARAALAKAVRDFSNLKSSGSVSSENLKLKEIDVDKLKRDYSRDLEAYKAGVISKQQLDLTKHNLDSSVLALSVAKEQEKNIASQVKSEDIYSHPIVQMAISNYKRAKINLDRTNIYATNSGVIGKKFVSPGQQVAPNQQLFTINNLNSIWVDANFKETEIKDLKIGNAVEVKSDLNEKIYEGKVIAISSGTGSSMSLLPAQNATGNWIKIVQRVPVKIQLSPASIEANGTLPIGSSALVTIDNRKMSEMRNNGLIIPTPIASSNGDYLNEIQKEIDEIIKENM